MTKRLDSEALLDRLDADIAWRRVELAAVKTALNRASGPTTDMAARAAVALSYAHLEGYVISAGRLLVQYVADRRLRYEQLADPYVALCVAAILTQAQGSRKRIKRHIDVIVALRCESEIASFPQPERIIQASGNLKSEKFADILLRLGLDPTPFELQYNWLDSELLRRRNSIAHGETGFADVQFADEAIDRVRLLIDAFRNAAQNAAVLEDFKRQTRL